MAFYKKEELFQIIVEDSWIECISLFPAILINNLEENMESSGNGFFVYFVFFFSILKKPWDMGMLPRWIFTGSILDDLAII